MLRNRKGFADIVIITAIAATALVTWLIGPTIVKGISGAVNQKKATRSVQSERILYQVDPQHPDKLIPVKEKYSEQNYQSDFSEPPETLWQKFWKMGAMAIIIIVILSYLGLWPIIRLWWNKTVKPKLEQAQEALEEKEELRGDAKLIVISVDEGLAALNSEIAAAQASVNAATQALNNAALTVDPTLRAAEIAIAQKSLSIPQAVLAALVKAKQEFLTAMSRKQDTTTKLLVAELKND